MDPAMRTFALTGDGLWAVDANQRIVQWNAAAEAILGHTAEEALGRQCYQLLAGRDREGRAFCRPGCAIQEAMKRGQLLGNFDLTVQGGGPRLPCINVSIITLPPFDGQGHSQVLVHLFRPVADGWPGHPSLRIRLLGQTAVQRADGSLVEGPLWRRARVRALLAFLALRRGRPVHRDVLVDALWPDLDHPRALSNLNTTVYYLRRCLEPGLQHGADSSYVQVEGDCYSLSPDQAYWLDVEAFETGVGRARREADPGRAAAVYREALALYRGDFLADLEADLLDCWLERERLGQLYLKGLEELAVLCARQQQDQEAMELYLKVLAVDPCRETTTQQLMRLALRRGDRAGALAHYRHLERALWRDLEILPSQESCLLCDMAVHGGQPLAGAPRMGDHRAALRLG